MLRFSAFLLLSLIPAAAADPAMVQLIMPDAKLVAGADTDRIRNSPLGQRILSNIGHSERDLEQFAALTGFDPRRDLREVLFAARETRGREGPLIIARGSFDEARLSAFAANQMKGATIGEYLGVKTLVPSTNAERDKMAAFLGSIVIAGSTADVKAAIERSKKPAPALSPALASRITAASSAYDAFLLTVGSPAAIAGHVPNSTANGALKGDLVQAIEHATAGLRLGPQVEIAGEAVTRSEKDAAALADVMRFFASMLQSNAKDAPFSSLLSSMTLKTEGNTLKFSALAPTEEIEKLFQHARPRMRPAAHRNSISAQ